MPDSRQQGPEIPRPVLGIRLLVAACQIRLFFALSSYSSATDEGSTMLEMAIAAVFVTVAVVAISGRGINSTGMMTPQNYVLFEESSDLPCPWCRAQTREGDLNCAACGQKFG